MGSYTNKDGSGFLDNCSQCFERGNLYYPCPYHEGYSEGFNDHSEKIAAALDLTHKLIQEAILDVNIITYGSVKEITLTDLRNARCLLRNIKNVR